MFDDLFSRRGLSLDRIRTLLEVEAAGSIAAAGKGETRQSQFSRQLKELSEHFGLELTVRKGRHVKLTPAGHRVASLARQFLGGLENFENEVRKRPISIRLGAGDSLLQWLVIPRLGKHPDTFRKFHFNISNLQTREITDRLGDAQLDFGILRENARPAGVKGLSLGTLTYAAFIPKCLVRGKEVPSLQDALRDYPMAFQMTGGQFSEHLRRLTEGFGYQFAPALACQSFPQAAAAVRSGAYASILPTLAAMELSAESFFEVSDRSLTSLSRKLAIMWNPRIASVRPELDRAARDLAKALCL